MALADYVRLEREAFEARMAVLDALDGLTPAEKKNTLRQLDDLANAIAVVRAKVEAA